jgi:flagellar biogenesis protein FliO
MMVGWILTQSCCFPITTDHLGYCLGLVVSLLLAIGLVGYVAWLGRRAFRAVSRLQGSPRPVLRNKQSGTH